MSFPRKRESIDNHLTSVDSRPLIVAEGRLRGNGNSSTRYEFILKIRITDKNHFGKIIVEFF